LRIIFMGTPEFAVPILDMLVREGYDVKAVVAQPDKPKGRGNRLAAPPVTEYALAKGIDVLQPEKVRTPEFADELKKRRPDLLVTAAYGKILPESVLDIPPLGCINVHASLLPKYRGAAPIQRAIINGEKVTGITTMFTDAGMDTGDMLLQKELEITDSMTAGELHDRLSVLGAKVLRDTLKRLQDGTIERIPQRHEDATYAPMIDKSIGTIDWRKSSKEIHNLVRGVNPWPGACTFNGERRIRVWKTEVFQPAELMADLVPGKVCRVDRFGMVVAAGEGFVRITEIQFDSGRRMSLEECWHNLHEGEVLG
jgi:methionyl-tRNA formyltransferase